jgi:hypothetical protein
VPADEREARRQLRRRRDHIALGAARVSDDRRLPDVLVQFFQQLDILADRRRQHDEIGFREYDEIVRRDVDGV